MIFFQYVITGDASMGKRVSIAAIAVLAGAVGLMAAPKAVLDDLKCFVSGQPAKESKAADYREGKVFFCCGNCLKKYTDEPEAFATKANMQLVASQQYLQGACPLSGGELNPDTAITVGQAKVAFCCNNCKGKVEKAEGDEQMELVFSDKAFEKAKFAVAEEKK
jgi:hypothetical protein